MSKRAPEGFAELASDNDSSSEYEYKGPPIQAFRTSGRKRTQTKRFKAGPAKRAKTANNAAPTDPTDPAPADPLASSSSEDDEEDEQDTWVMHSMPTFEEKYPALHAMITGDIGRLEEHVYALVKDQVVCIDAGRQGWADTWSRPAIIANYYLDMISRARELNNLQPIPNIPAIVDQVNTKWHGSFIASPICPDNHPLLNTYQDIADAMQVQTALPSQTCEELFQECYDTTKTEAFRQAVNQAVAKPKPLIYAIGMWQQHQGSDNVKNFLVKYAHALYNRRMKQMNINIRF